MRTARRVLVTGTSYGLGAAVLVPGSLARRRGLQPQQNASGDRRRGLDPRRHGGHDRPRGCGRLVRRSSARGPFDGVVFNAALADKSRSQWTTDQVERHLRVNALGPFALWNVLVKRALVGDPCNVVLMGSFLQNGNVRQPAYAMSKAALWSWMRSYTMAQTPGARQHEHDVARPGPDTGESDARACPRATPISSTLGTRGGDRDARILYQERRRSPWDRRGPRKILIMTMRKVTPECNLETVRDGRGGIFTYYPADAPIVEWNLLFTKAQQARGFHFHTEFDEYVLITSGHGTYVEQSRRTGREGFLKVAAGDCLHFPAGLHTPSTRSPTCAWSRCSRSGGTNVTNRSPGSTDREGPGHRWRGFHGERRSGSPRSEKGTRSRSSTPSATAKDREWPYYQRGAASCGAT